MYQKELLSKLSVSWRTILKNELNAPYFKELMASLSNLNKDTKTLPPLGEVLNAYHFTSIENIKVVIIGQDPYHGNDQAHGLSFSVKRGVRQPPSLVNIFKELDSDLSISAPDKFVGDLTPWAKQGVFLLNAVLTVEQATPNAHKDWGWEKFTDATIHAISNERENVVFVLWGKYAQKKEHLIDRTKHLIISSPHPSPFSARRGFFGSKPFSQINKYLLRTNQKPINWSIK